MGKYFHMLVCGLYGFSIKLTLIFNRKYDEKAVFGIESENSSCRGLNFVPQHPGQVSCKHK